MAFEYGKVYSSTLFQLDDAVLGETIYISNNIYVSTGPTASITDDIVNITFGYYITLDEEEGYFKSPNFSTFTFSCSYNDYLEYLFHDSSFQVQLDIDDNYIHFICYDNSLDVLDYKLPNHGYEVGEYLLFEPLYNYGTIEYLTHRSNIEISELQESIYYKDEAINELENQVIILNSTITNLQDSANAVGDTFELIGTAVQPVISLLDTKIAPNISIGMVCTIPVVVAVLMFLLKSLIK